MLCQKSHGVRGRSVWGDVWTCRYYEGTLGQRRVVRARLAISAELAKVLSRQGEGRCWPRPPTSSGRSEASMERNDSTQASRELQREERQVGHNLPRGVDKQLLPSGLAEAEEAAQGCHLGGVQGVKVLSRRQALLNQAHQLPSQPRVK